MATHLRAVVPPLSISGPRLATPLSHRSKAVVYGGSIIITMNIYSSNKDVWGKNSVPKMSNQLGRKRVKEFNPGRNEVYDESYIADIELI